MTIHELIKKEVRIIDYARNLGFSVIRKGKYFSLEEHDSVIIDPEKNCFWRNSRPGTGNSVGKGGSIIDFIMEFTGLTLHETLKLLSELVRNHDTVTKSQTIKKKSQEIENKILTLPKSAGNMHNVYAYLIKTRKIASWVVQRMVDKKQLYQDIQRNCVFVSFDIMDVKKPVFVCKRGTNTFKPFYQDLVGCDYTQCFYINNDADKIFVTESVIDALSIMTLRANERYNFLVLSGVGKTDCISRYLNLLKIGEIHIGTDSDEHGKAAAQILQKKILNQRPDIKIIMDMPPDTFKDWNEYLQGKSKGGTME